jgi:Apolipoprotein N-acyltransferase
MSTKNLFLALLSGILLGLSFPPFHLGFLAWIFLVPLFKIFYEKNKFQEKALSFYIARIYKLCYHNSLGSIELWYVCSGSCFVLSCNMYFLSTILVGFFVYS